MAVAKLNQILSAATPGDAITDQALQIRRWLRDWGFDSKIFADHIHPDLAREVRSASLYRPKSGEYLILHHSIGAPIVDAVAKDARPLILIYHNVTLPEFFDAVNPALAGELRLGRDQLDILRPHTVLALGVSAYNQAELIDRGYENTGVLPIALDTTQYDLPINQALFEDLRAGGPLLLFVGRMMPHKRPEDLIKLLYYYRQIRPEGRVALVGHMSLSSYASWMEGLVESLDLADAVLFAGRVSQEDLITYYRAAELYVSMSEHEGFGKPLIESMYLDLPVMAFRCTGVSGTLGEAGVLFREKELDVLAEVVDILIEDQALRRRMIARGRERVQAFLEPQVRDLLSRFLSELGLKTL